MDDAARRTEFTRCWLDNIGRVAAYASRHVGPDDAHDVAAEAFLHAWRRWDEVPEPPLPWLIGTARKVVGNRRRGSGRQAALVDRLALLDMSSSTAAAAETSAEERRTALEALAALGVADREALLLVSWDGLDVGEAATVRRGVVGSRARPDPWRLRRGDGVDDGPSPSPSASGRRLSPVVRTGVGSFPTSSSTDWAAETSPT